MKKLLVIIFIVTASSALFADDNAVFQINMLIDDNLFTNQYIIADLAKDLTGAQKMMIYNQHKNDPVLPFILNLVLGCGIGSYIQGDTGGGTIALCGDLGGILLVSIGYASFNTGMFSAGTIVLLASRIYEIVQPFVYSNKYNGVLRTALGMHGVAYNVYMLPDANNNWSLTAVASIQF
ncbi:MAG TPA: P13 family porin [Spirochaetia bacterium]|nr:P13 family porin [Spirochaetales bacterium]HPD79485.1 P13 family porin [Spirochaetales bacterium]HRS66125.1 P13 family porin [Spirochaetia bacterium]HRV28714.1 P13 family porin [Spirochaetia bacterium]